MSFADAQAFLHDQIPTRHQVLIPPVLQAAYAAVKMVMASDPMLGVPSALDNRGRFVSWAVDFGIEKLIQSGRWPVDYRWREYGPMNRVTREVVQSTGHYLEVRLSHSTLTVSQVADPKRQPRNVRFRENARLINEPFLKGLDVHDPEIQGLPSVLLTHGYRDLHFAHFGVPHAQNLRKFVYQTDNLLALPHDVSPDTAQVENTDFEDTMTLKEEIEQWRKDHGG